MPVRTDLDGRIVRAPDREAVYLINEGLRHYIPNPETFNNLFRDWNRIDRDSEFLFIKDNTK